MQKLFLLLTALFTGILGFSQGRVFTKSAAISFFSKTPAENIEAHNKHAVTVLDQSTGEVEFSVLMKGFEFEKALMQEHFNENYVESDQFPKAVFKGKINEPANVNYSKDGHYKSTVTGKLSLHGVTKEITAPVVVVIAGAVITASSEFSLTLSDYKIAVPSLVKDKISNTVKITVISRYQPLN
ncbi:YceI family protein [Lacibacter sp.]|uniref:YceI family protein n=1 Tax=Lacibacter sp. TaxID=1915409 RepID=UPI002B4B9585|nr:YceI family protein [Lacibacter sp.]HLP39483.1 YceI family protein [Lacibacter sp.]